MINNSLIMLWKIIWKLWRQYSSEVKMSIILILYPLFIFKHKRKGPSLHNLISNLIVKESDLSKSILASELHSRNLIVLNSKQKLLLLISGENTSVLTLNGKIHIKNMEITSLNCHIQIHQFLKILTKRVTLSIWVWEKIKKT